LTFVGAGAASCRVACVSSQGTRQNPLKLRHWRYQHSKTVVETQLNQAPFMNAATLTRLVESGAFIASIAIAIVAAGADLMSLQASPVSTMPVYELPRVMVTGQRMTKDDSDLAQRVVGKPAVCS